jgi:hypothetical protein
MFNSNILDVAIGMIFIYLLLSLMCSAANEIIELMLKKRAIDLERGLRELLCPGTASGTDDIVAKLYNHALINNLFGGTYEESRIGSKLRRVMRTQLPSYIPARSFALALMDLVGTVPTATPQAEAKPAAPPLAPLATEPLSGAAGATVGPPALVTPAQVVVNLPPTEGGETPPPVPAAASKNLPETDNPVIRLRDAICNSPLLTEISRRSLVTCLDAAGSDVGKARENIENWFNSSMDRVSSWYKRRAQLTILVVGLFVAITVNVDTITVAKRLSTDKGLRESLVAAADAYAKANAPENAVASPSPANSPEATPTPIPECVKDPKSDECKRAKELQKACEDPQSAECQRVKDLQEACQDASSPECKSAKELQQACKDPNSDKCKEALALQQACKEPNSDECQAEKAFQLACQDSKSDACKAARLNRDCEDPTSSKCQQAKACSDPNSIECKNAKALVAACKDPNSPKCKYLSNQQQLQALGLPVGWDDKSDPKRNFTGWTWAGDRGGWWDQLQWHWLGWLLTALAISLGAPFWFDLLNKFIVIRSAVKPHEKSPEEGSKD